MSGIEVTRESEDRLHDQYWRFEINSRIGSASITLHLSYYALRSRPSIRHKFREEANWDRSDRRQYRSSMTEDQVPIPEDVAAEATRSVGISVVHPKSEGFSKSYDRAHV